MASKSGYTFLWGDNQPLWTVEAYITVFMKYRHIVWNRLDNILLVSRDNKILTFHSTLDVERNKKRGRLYLDVSFPGKFISRLEKAYKKHWKFFNSLKKVNPSKLSNDELFLYFKKTSDLWSSIIGYFGATQAEPTYYLIEKIKKYTSNQAFYIIMAPSELDIANKEQIDWWKLVKKDYSEKKLMEHARRYPWVVMSHFTYKDVIDTLRQRYEFDKNNHSILDINKEKKEIKGKQDILIKRNPKLKPLMKLVHRLSLSRMEIKSCWAGSDFYLIPIIKEISSRTGEQIYDINKYYRIDEIKELLKGKRLTAEEKERRKMCFVGLLKNGKAVYESGDSAEKLAKKELKGLYETRSSSELKGVIANSGKVVGVARVLEANNVSQLRELRKSFQKGQIIVTQMTQPSVMDIASKAAALVTDEGGMLSHAAVISREFKIPCIVGTHFATSTIKDGEMIEVDAEKGIVKKIKS